jgi:hypothetical protein
MGCLRAMNGTIHAKLHKDEIFSLYLTKYLTYRKTRKEAKETALHIFFLSPQYMFESVKKEEAGGARSWYGR